MMDDEDDDEEEESEEEEEETDEEESEEEETEAETDRVHRVQPVKPAAKRWGMSPCIGLGAGT